MLDINNAVTKIVYRNLEDHSIIFDSIEEVINYMQDNPNNKNWETVKYQEITL
jgi:hypothetical protein